MLDLIEEVKSPVASFRLLEGLVGCGEWSCSEKARAAKEENVPFRAALFLMYRL